MQERRSLFFTCDFMRQSQTLPGNILMEAVKAGLRLVFALTR